MKLHNFIAAVTFLFLVISIVPPIIGDLNSDRQALLHFAANVPHARKFNWNTTNSVCSSWIGITCNLNGTRVIAIHLPGFGLYGLIPANSFEKLDALKVLSLRSNYLSGNLPSGITSIPSLQYLYLQHNNFSGAFPDIISPQLTVLDLSFNSFTGNIPPTFQNLTQLSVLNLQNNSISGAIPPLNLPRLKSLNLSYNNLNGSIPSSLQQFPNSSFVGNSLLCGQPVKSCYPITSSPSSPIYFPTPTTISQHQHASSSKKLGSGSIIAIAIGGCAVLFLLLAMFFVCCLKKGDSEGCGVLKGKVSGGGRAEKPKEFGSGVQEAEKNKLCFFEGCSYNFDLDDLLRASAEVLGKGSYGSTYKAILEDGTTVVVKRLKEVAANKREFEQQMGVLARVGQHPNVIPVRAYYYSKDEKLLVFNYMPAGSLFMLLHGNRNERGTSLDWSARVKVALGTARGIAHIHNHSEGNDSVKFTHGNIKSSNVLLTQDLDGCISDVGLAPLMNYFPTTMPRTIGYRAPEVIETRKVSQKSDVYSFGVLLLEMLTGKAPLQQSGHDDVVDLPRWVRSIVREEWTAEVFDVELMKYQNVEEEMVQMLQIGLACVEKLSDMRPEMNEVVRMIEEIQQPAELKNRTSSEAESNV